MQSGVRQFLRNWGRPAGDLNDLPSSEKRFPDGAHFRVEIPSTEGPECLRAVLEEAQRMGVPVHRVSQGSGVTMLTDAELDEMAASAARARVEVSLFCRPCAAWGLSALARAPLGALIGGSAHGQEEVVACLEDALRAAEHGFRSILIADIGVLAAFQAMRAAGSLPCDMQAKISVMLPASNPLAARVLQDLGANTLNVPTDLSLSQLAAIRQATDVPLDVYIEAPDNLGGFVRLHEMAEVIRVAAPVYVKFGLRNAPDIYPSGTHLAPVAVGLSRERVRRAKIALDLLSRSGLDFSISELGAEGLALPRLLQQEDPAKPVG